MKIQRRVGRPTTGPREPHEGELYCKECKNYLPVGNFKGNDNYCIPCRKAYNRRYFEETKWKYRQLAYEAKGSKCNRCTWTDIRVMQFHHTEEKAGEKNNRTFLKAIADGTRPDIEMLCANCHRIEHWDVNRSF